jgi:hypothetical protein
MILIHIRISLISVVNILSMATNNQLLIHSFSLIEPISIASPDTQAGL